MFCKKGIIGILVFVLSVLSNTMVFADCSTTTCVGKIKRLYHNSEGLLYIATDGDEGNLDCDAVSGRYVTLPPGDEYFDRRYAMLLTAMSLQKKVGLRIITGSDNCSLSYIYMED